MNNKILLLGSKGYIGSVFKQKLPEGSFIQMDYDKLSVQNLLNSWSFNHFDTIINCTGYTEGDKELSIYGNLNAPIILTEFVNIVKEIKILHISSCSIYKNYVNKIYSDNSKPNYTFSNSSCIDFHAGTKALAEQIIRRYPNHYICRAGILFDQFDHPKNYLTKLKKIDKLLEIKNSLTNRQEFVEACIYLLENKCDFGSYNITNSGFASTSKVCDMISKHLGDEFSFYDCVTEYFFSKDKKEYDYVPSQVHSNKIINLGFKMSEVYDSIEKSLEQWT
jgi:dTDP-4-dehydrorhamnose reductase